MIGSDWLGIYNTATRKGISQSSQKSLRPPLSSTLSDGTIFRLHPEDSDDTGWMDI
jgi:hypothetical protein